MKTSFIYGAVGVGVAVIAGAVFVFVNRTGAPGPNHDNSPAASQASLKELFAQGKSQKCTFAHAVNNTNSNGTVYMSSGKMRGDFSSSVSQGTPIDSHMIVDGTTAYVWSGTMTKGLKMDFSAIANQGASDQAGSGSVNPDQRLDYSCSNWNPEQSRFALPAGVEFTDMAAMMGAAMGNTPAGAGASGSAGAASYCSYCNQIPDANGKAQCQAMYKCQ